MTGPRRPDEAAKFRIVLVALTVLAVHTFVAVLLVDDRDTAFVVTTMGVCTALLCTLIAMTGR